MTMGTLSSEPLLGSLWFKRRQRMGVNIVAAKKQTICFLLYYPKYARERRKIRNDLKDADIKMDTTVL